MEEQVKKTPAKDSEQQLEDLYRQYFSSPKSDEDDLTQVSMYDYSLSVYTSDSSGEPDVSC